MDGYLLADDGKPLTNHRGKIMKIITKTIKEATYGYIKAEDGTTTWGKTGFRDEVVYSLKITDKYYATAEKDYNIVRGKVDACDFKTICDAIVALCYDKKDRIHKDCTYLVRVFADNSGYAKSCKWRKKTMVVDAVVKVVSGSACKVESLKSERIDLYSGQSVYDSIYTHGFGARKEAFKALTGMSCPIRRMVGKDVEKEWNDAVENIYDFAI
jgi:hypothetical protein